MPRTSKLNEELQKEAQDFMLKCCFEQAAGGSITIPVTLPTDLAMALAWLYRKSEMLKAGKMVLMDTPIDLDLGSRDFARVQSFMHSLASEYCRTVFNDLCAGDPFLVSQPKRQAPKP